jgi:hypothetical protein
MHFWGWIDDHPPSSESPPHWDIPISAEFQSHTKMRYWVAFVVPHHGIIIIIIAGAAHGARRRQQQGNIHITVGMG